jgi:hypothetical protein
LAFVTSANENKHNLLSTRLSQPLTYPCCQNSNYGKLTYIASYTTAIFLSIFIQHFPSPTFGIVSLGVLSALAVKLLAFSSHAVQQNQALAFHVRETPNHFQTTMMSINDALSILFQGYTPSIILSVLGVLLLIRQRLAIRLDPQEPPILKPKIPYIGHIIGLLQYNSGYYDRL